MGLFDKIFGKKQATQPTIPVSSPVQTDPSKDPNMIRVFDGYGREMFITKQVWRDSILKDNLRKAWNTPQELYQIIVMALNDGFRSDVVNASRQLYKIDPDRLRGACVWGIVLMEEGRLDEAEKVLREYITKHGEAGVILTNLAKVYHSRKNETECERLLFHGLELDPNQDNGFGWYVAIHQERGGDPAAQEAMRRVAQIPGSWRARLWLARGALVRGSLDDATALYEQALTMVPQPVPADFLMQMSGDLGQRGYLAEILRLCEPHFKPDFHGITVGNNLIKAHLDLGQLDEARQVLNQLYALKRPDWQLNLSFWDTEIAKARVDLVNIEPVKPPKTGMLTIDGPIWLKPTSPARELLPARATDGLVISFLGSTAETASNSQRTVHQMADAAGRISRALPLFLAEQVEFGSQVAAVQTLMPWIAESHGGFIVSRVSWKDEDAATYARQASTKADYVIVSHLKTQTEPWEAEVRLVRTIDGKCLGVLQVSFPMAQPEASIPRLAQDLLTLLHAQAEVSLTPPPTVYKVPTGTQFPYYLLRLEQLLAVRCGTMEGVNPGFLSGERDIVLGNLQLCLDNPDNLPARLTLAQTLQAMRRVHPEVVQEFKDKVVLLQKEKPLPAPLQGVVQRLIDESFSTSIPDKSKSER